MQSRCFSCGNVFVSEKFSLFCPQCNKILSRQREFESVVDRILFDGADWKTRYLGCLSNILKSFYERFSARIEETIAGLSAPISFSDELATVAACENRRNLLAQTDKLMQKLSQKISATPAKGTLNVLNVHVESADLEAFARKLLIQTEVNAKCAVEDIQVLQRIEYDSAILTPFYEDLRFAYKKYVLCVRNNDMFAAFPFDSDFGNVGLLRKNEALEIGETEGKALSVLKETEILRQSLQNEYYGGFDEDCLPHVEAFWRGIRALCAFLGENERRKIVRPEFIFNDEILFAIRESVESEKFEITEKKLHALQALGEEIQ